MLCSNPFIRNPKVTPGEVKAYEGARLDATPFGCGQCLSCRINQAREWTCRILLEALAHESSLFVTLTYTDDFLPCRGSLDKRGLQNYLKRLRNRIGKFRYFGIGEYGDRTLRPHYHLILFGVDISKKDKIIDAWMFQKVPIGMVHFGECNIFSARYIAGYTTSKVTKYHNDDIAILLKNKEKEFMLSSRAEGNGVGVLGLEKMANSILNQQINLSKVGIIRTIKIGGKEFALGRYLTRKLGKMLGIDEKEFDREFWIHQEALFKNFLKDDKFEENVRKFFTPKANAKEKRFKFFNKARKL